MYTLDWLSCMGATRAGIMRGAISQRYVMAKAAPIEAGPMKSNILNSSMPMSAATLTTSRLVDVPMVVAMPPRMLANPMGISVPVGETPARMPMPTRMGNISTTIGVLLMKALRKAVIMMVNSRESIGPLRQTLARNRPTGSSAPVRIRPSPTIISAHTAIRAL